jgi:glycosyltransferase 2 family protein
VRYNVGARGGTRPQDLLLSPTSPPHATSRARWLAWLRRLARPLAIAVVVASTAWMLRDLHLAELVSALHRVSWWPIAISAALNFLILLFKAMAWRLLLGPRHPVPVHRLFSYTIGAYAGSALLPMRAGEVLRLWLLRERDGVPMERAAAVAVAEKLLDIVAILLVVAPLPWLVDDPPVGLRWWLVGSAVAVALAVAALRALAKRLAPERWLARFAAQVSVEHRPRTVLIALVLLILACLVDFAEIELVLWAVGIDAPVSATLMLLFLINVTIAVPSTPGQVGALELGALIAFGLYDIPRAQGLAFAIWYHALQIVPVVAVGLLLHARLLFGVSRQKSERDGP